MTSACFIFGFSLSAGIRTLYTQNPRTSYLLWFGLALNSLIVAVLFWKRDTKLIENNK